MLDLGRKRFCVLTCVMWKVMEVHNSVERLGNTDLGKCWKNQSCQYYHNSPHILIGCMVRERHTM